MTEDNNFNIIKSNIVGNYCKAIEEGLSKQNDIIININYIEQAQKTISNLSLSDWFSPVPMCPPSDSMGYFSLIMIGLNRL
ncbi:hypothetical protein [Candidatus Bealeia paramacronuclearis]|uniref:hypothetical protein n=1 Tax=Candidatus Bealeia paramacronuclearis TaxID=1921001 RepID=UPI0030CF084C